MNRTWKTFINMACVFGLAILNTAAAFQHDYKMACLCCILLISWKGESE